MTGVAPTACPDRAPAIALLLAEGPYVDGDAMACALVQCWPDATVSEISRAIAIALELTAADLGFAQETAS
jgi:hypothetical protein